MPSKSWGLHVCRGRRWADAVAAIMASKVRALALRPERRSDAATVANALRRQLEGQRFERRLRLLQTELTSGPFPVAFGHEGPDRQFDEGDGGDDRLLGEVSGIDTLDENDGARIEHADVVPHSDESSTVSTSWRKPSGSTGGRPLNCSTKTAAVSRRRGKGRNSVTGSPSRVTTMGSPPATRSTSSPPRLRRSRMLASVTGGPLSRVIRLGSRRTVRTLRHRGDPAVV